MKTIIALALLTTSALAAKPRCTPPPVPICCPANNPTCGMDLRAVLHFVPMAVASR